MIFKKFTRFGTRGAFTANMKKSDTSSPILRSSTEAGGKRKRLQYYRLILLAFASLAMAPSAAHAAILSLRFGYEDSNGAVTGNATLNVTPLFNNPGAFLATSGNLNIDAPAADNISGDYKLFASPTAPNASLSPTGLFIYDNLVFPGGRPVVTNPGLLGFGGNAPGSTPEGRGREINFFSNGENTYELYTGVNGSYPYSHEFTTATGSVTTTFAARNGNVLAAPEPGTWIVMASFLMIRLFNAGSLKAVRE